MKKNDYEMEKEVTDTTGTPAAPLWIRWDRTVLAHFVSLAGKDGKGRVCYQTRCGRRLYARDTERAASDMDKCKKCSERTKTSSARVAPPINTWSNVHKFEPPADAA